MQLSLIALNPPTAPWRLYNIPFPPFFPPLGRRGVNTLQSTAQKINTSGCSNVYMVSIGQVWVVHGGSSLPILQFVFLAFVKSVKPHNLTKSPPLKLDANEFSSGFPRRTLWNWLARGNCWSWPCVCAHAREHACANRWGHHCFSSR